MSYTEFFNNLRSITDKGQFTEDVAGAIWLTLGVYSVFSSQKKPTKTTRVNLDNLCNLLEVKFAIRQHQAIFQSECGEFTVSL